MANFSVNQNRQFYVVKEIVDSEVAITDASAVGLAKIKLITPTGQTSPTAAVLTIKGADTVLRTDIIPGAKITYLKGSSAKDLRTKLKKVVVALDANVNSGAPISGQDYILRINFSQFFGLGDTGYYVKEGAVHATAGMTDLQFYQKMVDSLNAAFAREAGATKQTNPYLTFSADASGITIVEKEQEWALGIHKQRSLIFEVTPTTVYDGSTDVTWGTTVVTYDGGTYGNGKKIADLEWFCAGERGDQYRGIGYPNNIPTQYLVDPTKEYNVLDIHYTFNDTGVNSYSSEKEITIVSESAFAIDTIISALCNAAQKTFASLFMGVHGGLDKD